MNFYVVRTTDDCIPIGMFRAEDSGQLAIMVDPRTSPSRCEYLLVDSPIAIMFDHPSHEVSWSIGIKEEDIPDDDTGEKEEWFENRVATIQNSIGLFYNEPYDPLSDILGGEKNVHGWRKFSREDIKTLERFWLGEELKD